MKKKLVALLMVSALAVSVLAGCGSKGDAEGDAAAAATGEEAPVVEDAGTEEVVVEDSSAALSAAIEEAAATADTGAAVAAATDAAAVDATAAEAAVEEYVDDEVIAADDAAEADATAVAAAPEETEDVIVDPGTYYTVRFGGDVYGTPDESTPVIDYVYPDWQLLINERLDDYWYAISYIVDGVTRTGYIKIQ